MNHPLVYILLAAFAALAISAVVRRIPRKKPLPAIEAGSYIAPPTKSAEDRSMLMAQLRAIGSLVIAVVLFVALLRPAISLTGMAGLPLALTAGLAASAGLLMFSALPATKIRPKALVADGGTSVSASLTPRRPWSFGRRLHVTVPLAVAVAFIAFLVVAGMTSSPDEQGRYRVLRSADAVSSSAASPYPGWFYGIPLILVTLALAGSAMLALHRISATHALPDPRMAGLDRRWREISTQVVLRLGTGALLAYFGGTAVMAGQAMASVAVSGSGDGYRQPLFGLGVGSGILGAALAVTGVVLLVLAAKASLTIRASARERASADQSTPSPATP